MEQTTKPYDQTDQSNLVSDSLFGPGMSDEKDWAVEMGWNPNEMQDGLPPDAILFGMNADTGESEEIDES
jgi:hypothetical protein